MKVQKESLDLLSTIVGCPDVLGVPVETQV